MLDRVEDRQRLKLLLLRRRHLMAVVMANEALRTDRQMILNRPHVLVRVRVVEDPM